MLFMKCWMYIVNLIALHFVTLIITDNSTELLKTKLNVKVNLEFRINIIPFHSNK